MIGKLTTEQFKAAWYGRTPTTRIAAMAGVSGEAVAKYATMIGMPTRGASNLDVGKSPASMEDRIKGDVERILHEIMQRRNYTAATRDSLHITIEKIIEREIKAFCNPKKHAA